MSNKVTRFLVYGNSAERKNKRMNRIPAFFKARELFAHKRILVFWFVALLALAAPWLWFAFGDRELVSGEVGSNRSSTTTTGGSSRASTVAAPNTT